MRELNISPATFDLLLKAGLSTKSNNKYNLLDAKRLLSVSDPEATTGHKHSDIHLNNDTQLDEDIDTVLNDANISTKRQQVLIDILQARIKLAQLKVQEESNLWIERAKLDNANIEVYVSLATLTFNIKERCKLELINLDKNRISSLLDKIIFEEVEKFKLIMNDTRESELTFYDVIEVLKDIEL
jgi:hypothetical protein